MFLVRSLNLSNPLKTMTDQKTVITTDGEEREFIPPEGGDEGEVITPKGDEVIKDDEDVVPSEIPLRNQSHIIARQKRTIERLRSKTEKDEPIVEENDDSYDDTPVKRSAVDRQVRESMAPVIEELAKGADESELRDLFRDNPDAKRYDKRIRAYMEKWTNTPAEAIYHYLARQSEIVSKKKKDADNVAAHYKTEGSSHRPSSTGTGNMPSTEDLEALDDEEFEALQRDVNSGKYIKR